MSLLLYYVKVMGSCVIFFPFSDFPLHFIFFRKTTITTLLNIGYILNLFVEKKKSLGKQYNNLLVIIDLILIIRQAGANASG